jgi:hypothetical protein
MMDQADTRDSEIVTECRKQPDIRERLIEYRKMKYIGDCKCGDCQLVPLQFITELDGYILSLRAQRLTLAALSAVLGLVGFLL